VGISFRFLDSFSLSLSLSLGALARLPRFDRLRREIEIDLFDLLTLACMRAVA